MKVFQVNTVYRTGSTGRIVSELKNTLENHGDKCVAAYGRGKSDEKDTFCISNKADLYVHVFLTRITDRTGFYSKKATIKLINMIIKEQPDLIHLHNIHGYYLNIELLFRFLAQYKRPVVWTLHDCWPITGHCTYFEKFGGYSKCTKWKNQCQDCDRSREYPKSFKDGTIWNYKQKKKLFTYLDNITIITVSDWLKKQIEESFLKKYPVHTIYNGVNKEIFNLKKGGNLREIYKLQGKKIVLGVANVWSLLKGLEDFIQLSKILNKDEYTIILLGIDEQKKQTLPPSIIALPRTENLAALAAWYREADVYCCVSRAETFGMTVIEALACGTPVVSYDICAMREIITPGSGFLAKNVGDIKEIAELIYKCDKKNMMINCVDNSNMFDTKKQLEKYLILYEKILYGSDNETMLNLAKQRKEKKT